MHSRRLYVPLLPLLLAASACFTGTHQLRAPMTANLISATELRATGASNLYDAITQTRPAFFATRGATSFLAEPASPIVVIVNQSIEGGIGELRRIDAKLVRSVRRLSAPEVYQLTGRSAPSGGIEVLLGP
jgi:hypothetical protein